MPNQITSNCRKTQVKSNIELNYNTLCGEKTTAVLLQMNFSDMSYKIVSFLPQICVHSLEMRFGGQMSGSSMSDIDLEW